MQSIGCCFDTGTTSFPLAASLTISVTFLKSGNAIVDSLEYTKVPLTDTSNVPVNTQQWIPVRSGKCADWMLDTCDFQGSKSWTSCSMPGFHFQCVRSFGHKTYGLWSKQRTIFGIWWTSHVQLNLLNSI